MSDSTKADDARDDFILQERLSGRSTRSISKELHCTTADVDASLDRTLPKITNEAKRRMAALDLDRLDGLIEVFYKRAIEKVDAQAGLLVVKILERKSALLGLDSPQKLDIVQVQAQQQPTQFEKISAAIMQVANSGTPAQRAVRKRLNELSPEAALALLGEPTETNGNDSGDSPSEPSDALSCRKILGGGGVFPPPHIDIIDLSAVSHFLPTSEPTQRSPDTPSCAGRFSLTLQPVNL